MSLRLGRGALLLLAIGLGTLGGIIAALLDAEPRAYELDPHGVNPRVAAVLLARDKCAGNALDEVVVHVRDEDVDETFTFECTELGSVGR